VVEPFLDLRNAESASRRSALTRLDARKTEEIAARQFFEKS